MAGIECVEDDALQVWREGDGRRQGNHSVANGKAWEWKKTWENPNKFLYTKKFQSHQTANLFIV